MNANEVMANVALELTGHQKGEYSIVDPHDHLNMSQSTNDSYPTALKVAILRSNDTLVTRAAGAGAARSAPRATRSSGSSRWAAPRCRTPCR